MPELNKSQLILLLIIFVALGGIILYGEKNENNFSPIDYVIKR
jgi:Ni,Fe-hydrogenase I cytochrome b subunit